jgi:hypothetical protein
MLKGRHVLVGIEEVNQFLDVRGISISRLGAKVRNPGSVGYVYVLGIGLDSFDCGVI